MPLMCQVWDDVNVSLGPCSEEITHVVYDSARPWFCCERHAALIGNLNNKGDTRVTGWLIEMITLDEFYARIGERVLCQ